MSLDLAAMIDQIAELRDVAASRTPTQALVGQIEDGLAAGYACALTGDAWSMRTEQRLHELAGGAVPVAAHDLRALACEHARLRRELIALRRELAQLRNDGDRLRADMRASSRGSDRVLIDEA